jgi:hypothetical protein
MQRILEVEEIAHHLVHAKEHNPDFFAGSLQPEGSWHFHVGFVEPPAESISISLTAGPDCSPPRTMHFNPGQPAKVISTMRNVHTVCTR